MPDLNLTKLREIANAATPGEWTADIHQTRRRSRRTRRIDSERMGRTEFLGRQNALDSVRDDLAKGRWPK